MSKIDSGYRAPFFPSSREAGVSSAKAQQAGRVNALGRNSFEKVSEINDLTSNDARVDISDAIKDFGRIKKAVDAAPEIDNSAKIARLKQQIQTGTYDIDYDALADKIIETEF